MRDTLATSSLGAPFASFETRTPFNVSGIITILSERERIIIYKRYGLYNYEELTQKEIAKELNISRSYVSRIEKRALTKLLREFIKNKNFEK